MNHHTTTPRTRPATWVPRRVYYVLAYLKRQLTPGKPQALSNYQIKEALRFGSEGEVSQIMRWLSGDLPTMGRWAYRVLNTPQIYRFITRERMPSGGYALTLLAVPKRIDPPEPEAVQLSFLDDPSMIPLAAHQDAANEGSSTAMRVRRDDRRRQDAPERRRAGDHHEEIHEESDQKEEFARPLFERLLREPGISRTFAERIARNPIGDVGAFEHDLMLAAQTPGIRSPFYFTAFRWRDGQRVVAPQEQRYERPARSARTARSRARSDQSRRQPDTTGAAPPERGPVRTQLIY